MYVQCAQVLPTLKTFSLTWASSLHTPYHIFREQPSNHPFLYSNLVNIHITTTSAARKAILPQLRCQQHCFQLLPLWRQ